MQALLTLYAIKKTVNIAFVVFTFPVLLDLGPPERDQPTAYVLFDSPLEYDSTEMVYFLFNEVSPLITQLDIIPISDRHDLSKHLFSIPVFIWLSTVNRHFTDQNQSLDQVLGGTMLI